MLGAVMMCCEGEALQRRSKLLTWALGLAVLVSTATACTGGMGGFTRALDEQSARRAIKARLWRSDSDFSNITVTVEQGIVLLTGLSSTEAVREEAEAIAWSAPKVASVANEIRVGDAREHVSAAEDRRIAGRVRAQFEDDRLVEGEPITIEIFDGVVYLLGTVGDPAAARQAETLASGVENVQRVVSLLLTP